MCINLKLKRLKLSSCIVSHIHAVVTCTKYVWALNMMLLLILPTVLCQVTASICQIDNKCLLTNISFKGNFPRMENIAAFKPVSTSPARSTCGLPERSSYCQTPLSHEELMTCYQAFCVQECPYRSSTPPYAPLLLPAHR